MNPENPDLIEERSNWRSRHPLLMAGEQGLGFTCYHTNKLTWEAVERAIENHSSVEVDVQQVGPEWVQKGGGNCRGNKL
jgi:hypothetical protein